VEQRKFYPFGMDALTPARPQTRLAFTGHERDTALALDSMKARYSSPSLGRFHSVDPVEGKPAAPQSWNRFTYVSNNPMRLIDPQGLQEADPGDATPHLVPNEHQGTRVMLYSMLMPLSSVGGRMGSRRSTAWRRILGFGATAIVLGLLTSGIWLATGSRSIASDPLIVLLGFLLLPFVALFLYEMFACRRDDLFQELYGNPKGAKRRRFSRRDKVGHARVNDYWSMKSPRD
jgi:RHS repeat-associated protein